MDKSEEILINVTPREIRIALVENNVLQELHIERSLHQGLLGNIYKGRVSRILPGIQAAFVDIGLERSAFLHISDLLSAQQILEKDLHTELDIRDLLRAGQDILVQVYKDPLGSKGARLTTQFTIPSRFLVLTPEVFQVAVSQKISDEKERERLTNLIKPGKLGGYIFRTAAEGVAESDLTTDREFLDTLWAEIQAKAKLAKFGELVYAEIPILLRVLRDLAGYEVAKICVDNESAVNNMREYAKQYVPTLLERITYHGSEKPIFDSYSIEDQLQKALQRKVYLKSGGYLVFDQTEAMTTIDINSGSYQGNGNSEQTIFKINLEAVDVIARQVRLRNLGGIIIIDFIDMHEPLHKEQLLQALTEALARDTARVEVSELSSLGLVQMTRKRSRESLEHVLCVPCPLCQCRGSIKSLPTMCYEVVREIKRIAEAYPWKGFLVLASARVVEYLLEEESAILMALEEQLAKPIKLQAESSYTQEQYDILPLSEKE